MNDALKCRLSCQSVGFGQWMSSLQNVTYSLPKVQINNCFKRIALSIENDRFTLLICYFNVVLRSDLSHFVRNVFILFNAQLAAVWLKHNNVLEEVLRVFTFHPG